jgi:hypothetical protein
MPERLVLWENSFQTLFDAFDLIDERVDCGGFSEASDDFRRESALIQSFHALKGLAFVISGVREGRPINLMNLTEEERSALPSDFMYALRTAQLVHADSLLGGDPSTLESQTMRKRRAGIVEEQVGEAMRRYAPMARPSSGPGIRQSLDPRVLEALSGWLYDAVRIARA